MTLFNLRITLDSTHGARHGRNRAEAIARKVGAVGGIYTDQEKSPPSRHKESAQPVGGRSKGKLEFVANYYFYESKNFSFTVSTKIAPSVVFTK